MTRVRTRRIDADDRLPGFRMGGVKVNPGCIAFKLALNVGESIC